MENWFFAAGDLGFFWNEQLRAFHWLPQVFDQSHGLGFSRIFSLWLDYPFRLLMKILSGAGLSWWLIEKMLWLSVFGLAIYSSKKLAEYVLGKTSFSWLSAVVYAANTYIFLLFGGGQLGVAWAYAFVPFILGKFFAAIDSAKNITLKTSVRNGLWIALLVVFDLRFAYLAALIIGLYALYRRRVPLLSFITSLVCALGIHVFWILPLLLAGSGNGLSEEFTGSGMLRFLSVADFSHAFSLLHPNWPDNLFGKVYFLQPEFLLLPVIAFASLLVRKGKVHFYALLALVGAFFAKGVQEPFGAVYEWLFRYVPGFFMFRDATKFYLFVAVAYSILIPFVLQHAVKKVPRFGWIMMCGFVLLWAVSVRPLFTGSLSGNFRPTQLPSEYVQLKNILLADAAPSRTLWIPQRENYAYSSDLHPILATESAFVDDPAFLTKISDMGVRYVIVPTDVHERIFLTDYQFDLSLRTALVEKLQSTALVQRTDFNDLAVFEHEPVYFAAPVPEYAEKQQYWAGVGLTVSAVVLVITLVWLRFF